MTWYHILLIIIFAYLIGSFPTAILISKYIYKKDVRHYGSKNAGATNVFRVLGWKPGVIVLIIDIAKGWFATAHVPFIIGPIQPGIEAIPFMILAGFAAVIGHIWTVFAGFKGGKGVATGAGMLIGLAPQVVALCVILFLLVLFITRMVSMGSIIASISFPVILAIQNFLLHKPVHPSLLLFSVFIPVLIIYTHRSNIKRILEGKENKISFKKRER